MSKVHMLAIYQVTMSVAGIVVLAWALPKLAQVAVNLSITHHDPSWKEEIIRRTWPILVGFVLQTILGVYLLFGAPHLSRWQVQRIEAAQGHNSYIS